MKLPVKGMLDGNWLMEILAKTLKQFVQNDVTAIAKPLCIQLKDAYIHSYVLFGVLRGVEGEEKV